MPFSQDDTDRIRDGLRSALASPSLTDWQRTFLGDMQARFDQYGTRTRLSDKQYGKLKQLLSPYETAEPPLTVQVASPRPARRSQSPSRPVSPLRTIRKARRSARDIFWVLAVIFGFFMAIGSAFDGDTPPLNERTASTAQTTAGTGLYGAGDFSVTDGDTVQLYGARTGTRLVGFNTPETYEPRCERELVLGRQATARVKDLVRSADRVELRLVACACPPGTQGTRSCNFGRSCGVLTVDGRDVGQILIGEGLAVRFQCGRTSCPPLPRPWCG